MFLNKLWYSDNMFTRGLKIITLSAALSVLSAFASLAAQGAATFPYDIEFSVDEINRVCYAGHPGNAVVYKDGVAVTPDTSFKLVPRAEAGPTGSTADDLSVTVSLIYENNNNSGSRKEVVKQYSDGDIKCDEDYRIISDNAVTSLENRDKLYSDALNGMELTITSKGRDVKKKTVYLYMCSEDDFGNITDNTDGSARN